MTEERSATSRMSGADRREQLLDVALELFSRHGFDGTTVRDIAGAANVTDGLIYRYFASKEELLEQVIDRARRVLHGLRLEDAIERPVGPALYGLLCDLTRFLHGNMALVDVCWYEACRGGPTGRQMQALRDEVVEPVAALLTTWTARGELRVHDPVRAGRVVAGLAFSFAFANRCLTPTEWEAELATFMALAAEIFLDGLRAC